MRKDRLPGTNQGNHVIDDLFNESSGCCGIGLPPPQPLIQCSIIPMATPRAETGAPGMMADHGIGTVSLSVTEHIAE